MSNQIVKDVINFNATVLGIEQRQLGMMPEAESTITVACLAEEATEFADAVEAGDFIGQVDALIDSIYFATGALYKLGLNSDQIDACMSAVHDANMTKRKGVNAKRGDGSAADAVKPTDWVSPEERIGSILES